MTSFLKAGDVVLLNRGNSDRILRRVLNLSGIAGADKVGIERRLGPFPPAAMKQAKKVLAELLGWEHPTDQAPTC
jgi:mRNA-degrading endonuclease toxin of MazEF toxin-antitoxin module